MRTIEWGIDAAKNIELPEWANEADTPEDQADTYMRSPEWGDKIADRPDGQSGFDILVYPGRNKFPYWSRATTGSRFCDDVMSRLRDKIDVVVYTQETLTTGELSIACEGPISKDQTADMGDVAIRVIKVGLNDDAMAMEWRRLYIDIVRFFIATGQLTDDELVEWGMAEKTSIKEQREKEERAAGFPITTFARGKARESLQGVVDLPNKRLNKLAWAMIDQCKAKFTREWLSKSSVLLACEAEMSNGARGDIVIKIVPKEGHEGDHLELKAWEAVIRVAAVDLSQRGKLDYDAPLAKRDDAPKEKSLRPSFPCRVYNGGRSYTSLVSCSTDQATDYAVELINKYGVRFSMVFTPDSESLDTKLELVCSLGPVTIEPVTVPEHESYDTYLTDLVLKVRCFFQKNDDLNRAFS